MEHGMKILLFNMPQPKTRKIEELCEELGMAAEYIAKERYNENLGMMVGLDEYVVPVTVYEGKDLNEEMMVFFNLDSDQLDSFLKEYNRREIGRVNMKAVVTPHNVTWKPVNLFEELCKEHAKMHK